MTFCHYGTTGPQKHKGDLLTTGLAIRRTLVTPKYPQREGDL